MFKTTMLRCNRLKPPVLIIYIMLISLNAHSRQKQYKLGTDGKTDRAFWVKTLYRISYPVIHNLANGTLKKNMPLELGPGYYSQAKEITYLEALGRTLAGLAPWLALPDDESKEGIIRKKLRVEVLAALKNAADPNNPDYLNFDISDRQPIVDGAYLAQAFMRAPNALWEPLDEATKKSYINSFKSLRNRAAAYNNWLLFAAINEGFLMSIGQQYDPARIQFAIAKMKEWYVGDSWYSDGPKFSMDYYNSFVIHPMFTDLMRLMVKEKKMPQSDYDMVLKRMSRYSEFLERIISPEGTFPVYGRSVTYRTAAFQVLAQSALLEKLPEGVSPAQVRCGLTQVMHNLYDGNQNFDKNGWLLIGFNGHQPAIADAYTSTGSLYMATLGFLTLGLPADHEFWQAKPLPWTSLKAWTGEVVKKDYKVEY